MPLFDTNVLLIAAFKDSNLAYATREALNKELVIQLPRLWRYEFIRVVSKESRKPDGISAAIALAALVTADAYVTKTLDHDNITDVLQLAIRYNCAGYDAEFVYWAERLGEPLITNDLRLCRTVPKHTQTLEDYLAAH